MPFLFWRRGIVCHFSRTVFDTKPLALGVMRAMRRASSVIARTPSAPCHPEPRVAERAQPLTIATATKLVEEIESGPNPHRESAVRYATGVICSAPWQTYEEREQAQRLVARLFRLLCAAGLGAGVSSGRIAPSAPD